MEITWIQCVLIGIWTGVCLTGMLMGTYLTRCLVMAAGVGVILGDIETGLAMGAVGELAFLGFGVSSGGSVPPNPAGPGIIGAIIAITMKDQGVDTGAALAYSIPFAVLIQFCITGIYTLSTGFAQKAEEAVEQGRYGRFRLLANGTILMFVALGFAVGFAAAFQVEGLERLISAIPQWLTDGLGAAGKMLPAVGFAVILNVMAGVDVGPFALLGYVAAAFLGMPVIGIALVAAVFAWMEYNRERRIGARAKSSGTLETETVDSQAGKRSDGVPSGLSHALGLRPLPEPELRRLSRRTALKAYFLQNGYNYGNYEGLAYGSIMFPAIRKLFPEERDLRRELKGSLGYCSVNPNFLPILTSLHLVTLNHGISTEESRDVRLALMGPLAGIGDSLVQFCFAPVFSTIGAAMAAEGLMAGPVVFLLGMNALLLGLKLSNEALGFRLGISLIQRMEAGLEPISRAARMVGTGVIAGLAVTSVDIQTSLVISRGGEEVFALQEFLDTLLPGCLPVLYTGLLFWLLRKRRWSMYRLVGLTAVLGIGLKALGVLA